MNKIIYILIVLIDSCDFLLHVFLSDFNKTSSFISNGVEDDFDVVVDDLSDSDGKLILDVAIYVEMSSDLLIIFTYL
jgi:hypothetical protein